LLGEPCSSNRGITAILVFPAAKVWLVGNACASNTSDTVKSCALAISTGPAWVHSGCLFAEDNFAARESDVHGCAVVIAVWTGAFQDIYIVAGFDDSANFCRR